MPIAPRERSDEADLAAASRAIPIEQVISVQPFVVRRRIAFRDCDPAGIVYTPRFFDPIATGAADLFFMEICGAQGARDAGLETLGTPAKAINFVFHKATPLNALIDIRVCCDEIRSRTFTLGLEATNAEGGSLFSGRMTIICVDKETFTSIPVPRILRERLTMYPPEGDAT